MSGRRFRLHELSSRDEGNRLSRTFYDELRVDQGGVIAVDEGTFLVRQNLRWRA
jgi:hypothetical protein